MPLEQFTEENLRLWCIILWRTFAGWQQSHGGKRHKTSQKKSKWIKMVPGLTIPLVLENLNKIIQSSVGFQIPFLRVEIPYEVEYDQRTCLICTPQSSDFVLTAQGRSMPTDRLRSILFGIIPKTPLQGDSVLIWLVGMFW
jgi:hypothetical protein